LIEKNEFIFFINKMEGCCVCLEECITLIINSGWPVCNTCLHKLGRRCPSTRMEITIKLPNDFAREFYQYLQPPPVFDMEDLLKSSDKIAYMNQFDKFEIYRPGLLIKNNKCVLDLDEFKIFAKKCINLDCSNVYGERLIHRMSWINNLDMVKCLVANGVDVNCIGIEGWYPIHYACQSGDEALELVKFLIANGADVNCIDNWGWRPIHMACLKGDKALELVKFLVANGADDDCSANNGWHPIHRACQNGDEAIELVKFFLARGVDVNCATNYGQYPIHIAFERGSIKLIEFLEAHGAATLLFDQEN
jgi:hypothetical protein